MFHIVGVTPEAPDLDSALLRRPPLMHNPSLQATCLEHTISSPPPELTQCLAVSASVLLTFHDKS